MEIETQGEDVVSLSATETEDYPATGDEDDEAKNEPLSSRVRFPGGVWQLCLYISYRAVDGLFISLS